MSFLSPKTNLPGNLSDNTPGRQATTSPNEVLPLILGPGRAVVQWVTPVLRWKFRTTSTSNFAFASIYGWVALGPVDYIRSIVVNDKAYQGVFVHRDENPGDHYDFTISKETPERYKFFWGNEDKANYTTYLQSLVDPKYAPDMVGKAYPKDRGIFAVAVEDLECGRADGGTTPPLPKVEIDLYRRSPKTYSFGHVDHGTHLLGAAWDLLTLKRGGLKLDPALLNTTNWDAKIAQLYDTGIAGISGTDLFGSLVVADAKPGDEVLANILQVIDGHIRERDGKLEVDFMPGDGTTTDPEDLTTISEYEMGTGNDPEEDPDGVEEMPTQVLVTGLDLYANPPLTEASEGAQVPFARRLLGEDRPALQLNQPVWCTRAQIKASAQLNAARRAVPQWRGTVPVLKQYAVQPDGTTPLRAGDVFDLDRADIGLDLVVRIIEVSGETDTHVTFKVIAERGAFPRPYEPALDPRADADAIAPADLSRFVAAQLPPDLSDAADTLVCVLAERPVQTTIGYDTHFAPTDSWPGQVIDTGNTRWAVGCALQTTLGATLDAVTVTVNAVGIDWDYLISQSTLEQADDQLLCWHGGEWLSVGTITSLGSGAYTLGLLRARLGSLPVAHAIDDVIYLIYRREIINLSHASFAEIESGGVYDVPTATKYFKIRPYTGVQGNLSSAFSVIMRDPTPDQVTGLAVAMSGRLARLRWTAVVGALIDEYQVYRESWNGSSWDEDGKVGETAGLYFPDLVPDFGDYRWRVRASATDYTDGDFSAYVTGTAAPTGESDIDPALIAQIDEALDAATDAQATADGKVTTFIQASPPTAEGVGDLWIDTDDDNNLYRWNGSAWIDVADGNIAQALTDASNAQATADGKIVTFYQTGAPTAVALGDLWVDTDDGNRLYRWNGSAWVDAQGIRSDAPATPGAPTYSSGGTNLSDDGTARAYVDINVPALPSGASSLEVLVRENGATTWGIEYGVAPSAVYRVNGLSVGVAYQFAIRARSNFDIPSAVSGVLDQSAATVTTYSAVPAGGSISGEGVRAKFFPSSQYFLFGTRVGWAPVADKSLAFYRIKATSTNSDGATDYVWTPYDGNSFVETRDTQCFLYNTALPAGYVRVQAVSRSGVGGPWLYLGNANSAASIGTGNLAAQDSNDVAISSVRTGSPGAGSITEVIARALVVTSTTLSGGVLEESWDVSISGRGFSAAPDVVIPKVYSDTIHEVRYDASASSSSSVRIMVWRRDGTNVNAGNAIGIHLTLEEYP